MSIQAASFALSRRRILAGTASSVLSAGAITLLGGVPRANSQDAADDADVRILNVAVALEHEGIGAYAIALKSGLLDEKITVVATKFQDDHRRHNDALIAAIRSLGGEPVSGRPESEYAKALQVDVLKNQGEVLALARRLELGATNAYLGVIPSFSDSKLATVAARLAADEASHFALLNFTLGGSFLPALGFGA